MNRTSVIISGCFIRQRLFPLFPTPPLLTHMDIHLAILTVKLQPEAAMIGQLQEERLVPCGLFAATTYAISQGITYAVPALHQQGVPRTFRCCLHGRPYVVQSLFLVEPHCHGIGYIIKIRETGILRRVGGIRRADRRADASGLSAERFLPASPLHHCLIESRDSLPAEIREQTAWDEIPVAPPVISTSSA